MATDAAPPEFKDAGGFGPADYVAMEFYYQDFDGEQRGPVTQMQARVNESGSGRRRSQFRGSRVSRASIPAVPGSAGPQIPRVPGRRSSRTTGCGSCGFGLDSSLKVVKTTPKRFV